MPSARMHAARCHSLQIVVHATLNLLTEICPRRRVGHFKAPC